MSSAITQLVYALGLLGAASLGFRRGWRGLLTAFSFALPWYGLMVDLGVTVNIDRGIAAILILVVIARYGAGGFRGFGILSMVAIAITLVASMSLPDSTSNYAVFRGQWRWATQILFWALAVGVGAIIAALGTRSTVEEFYRTLVLSCELLAVLAIVQVGVFYATGLDLFPIGLLDSAELARSSVFDSDTPLLGVGVVFRGSAMGGEPKNLAYSLAVAGAIVLADMAFGEVLGWKTPRRVTSLLLLGAATVATFSTQGIALACANAVVIVLFAQSLRTHGRGRVAGVAIVACAAVVSVWIVPGLKEALFQRSVGRVMESGAVEDFNETILLWLSDNPLHIVFGAGLGNVHLHAVRYVPEEYLSYMERSTFVAKSGALRLVSEIGIVGLLAFLVTCLQPILRLWKAHRPREAGIIRAQLVITTIVVMDFLMSSDGPVYVFAVVGAAWAVLRGRNIETQVEIPTRARS